jgi:predicted double-glycine peptidase
MRAVALCCAAFVAAQTLSLPAQEQQPLQLLDVPFISQSELLCGGAAAAMVLRYWGERDVSAESFAGLVDRSASGIRTDALVADLVRRGWTAAAVAGSGEAMRAELARGRPVLTLIEDRPSTFHYIVIVAAHERGVVFHDPARAPFLVMSAAEFDRRWRAADRWMAVVLPGPRKDVTEPAKSAAPITPCEQQVAEGVRLAQANDLDGAERALSAAIGCPAAMRELSGVRVLQKRWAEASDLAAAAVEGDAADTYAWKVLATSRFVQNDRLGALAAWNHAGEPRLDLVRFEGLTRTRHRAVEQLVAAVRGEMLSPGDFIRASRRLAELPSASSTRLEYRPVAAGLAELRGVVAERPLLPTSRLSLAAMGLSAAATREVRATTGSVVGGGEHIEVAWRFWPRRPRVAVGIEMPAPWGGVVSAQAYGERQPFDVPAFSRAEQTGGRLGMSDWLTARWRWTVSTGLDEWSDSGARGMAGAALQFASFEGRMDATVGADAWPRRGGFATTRASLRARSSTEREGIVYVASGGFETASAQTPMNLWPAGDTGHARAALLRAHPVLDEGRLRVERLGRAFLHGSLEAQRWWRVAGPLRIAAAAFTDLGQTTRRTDSTARGDVDVGLGARVAVAGIPGVFRADLGKGLRDGAIAICLVYEP